MEEPHGNPLQSSCLENLMDRGTWRVTVHGVTKSQTRLAKNNNVTLKVGVAVRMKIKGVVGSLYK